jgi:polysaccharide biosynthesis transport protein
MISKNTDGIIKTNKTELASEPVEIERIAHNSSPAYDYAIERTDELDLRYYLDRVLRHKLIVAAVTILCTGVAAFFILGQEPEYTAKTRVQVDYENNGQIAGTADEPTTFVDRTYFNTQLELLQSPSLIRSAIEKLEQKSATEIATAKPESAGIRVVPNIIQAIYPIEKGPGTAALASDRTSPTDKQIEAIRDALSVSPVLKQRQAIKDTRLIEIAFTHSDPEVCALVTNAVADELVETNLDKKLSTNSTENKYLRDNIGELKAQIRADEERLLGYGRNYQLPTLEGSQNTVVERLVGLNRQLLEAENERKQAEAAYRTAQDPAAANAMAEEGAKQIAEIDNKLDELRQRRSQLLVEVTEKYPEVQEIDSQISVLERQANERRSRATNLYRTNAETRYKQALAKETAIRGSFDEQKGATMDQNAAAINYRIIQQSIETNNKLLDEMTKRATENEMLRAKVPNNIRVVDYASTPTEPRDKNNLQFLALAFAFSLSGGIGLALLRDYFDNGVQSVDDVERAMSSPMLAVVPGARNGLLGPARQMFAPNHLHLSGDGEMPVVVSGGPELILNSDGLSPICEAFRRLRAALLLSPSLGELKKILVTSSRKGEGKTTTSINIATSLAQAGVRVLLIDADLRAPRLHKVFSLNNSRGLTELLSDLPEREAVSARITTIAKNFDVLPAGPTAANSAEQLGTGNFDQLLEMLSADYDHIIVDSPPVTAFADSTVIATMVDGVLMVVQGNKNSQEVVKSSAKLLRMVGARIVGVVLNKVNSGPENYYGRYTK